MRTILTTPAPRKNILTVLPELVTQSVTTVRLHPRRHVVAASASKVGLPILWSSSLPWPMCPFSLGQHVNLQHSTLDLSQIPTTARVPMVPLLQLRAIDIPEMPFYPGTDLCQIFWCTLAHEVPWASGPQPHVVWHTSTSSFLPSRPPIAWLPSTTPPVECSLAPERVIEYPTLAKLSLDQRAVLEQWDVADVLDDTIDSSTTLYEWELSVCPGTKVGGEVFWIQEPQIPMCPSCGQTMTHFLTISQYEYDPGTYRRWLPIEERSVLGQGKAREVRVKSAAQFPLSGGYLYLFICRSCGTWPVQAIYQR